MTIEMVQLHDRLTAAEAIDRIRSSGIDDETVYTAYCIDNARHLSARCRCTGFCLPKRIRWCVI